MTVITKTQASQLRSTVSNLTDRIKARRLQYNMPYEPFVKFWWTDQEYQAVQDVYALADDRQIENRLTTLPVTMTIEHPAYPGLSGEHEVTLDCRYHAGSGRTSTMQKFWPHTNKSRRQDCDPAAWAMLESTVNDLVRESIDRALLGEVTTFLFDNCISHEQARYIFPPHLTLLRRAGMPEIANKIETVTKAQPSLAMHRSMRSKIIYLNQWFAIQELLGTFEAKALTADAGMVSLQLSTTHYFRFVVEDDDAITCQIKAEY